MFTITSLLLATLAAQTPSTQVKPLLVPPVMVGPYQVTVTDAVFSTRALTVEQSLFAMKGQKFLVVDYTVQNPGKTELGYDWGSLAFTVVGIDTNNYEYISTIVNPTTLVGVNLSLKPLQKIPSRVFIQVPANDPIHKLMIKAGDKPPIRIDLRGKVKKLTGPYADVDAMTLKDEGVTAIAQSFELGPFDVSVAKIEDVTTAIGDHTPEEGKKIVVASLTLTNPTKQNQQIDTSIYTASLFDANNEPMQWIETMLRGVGNTVINQELKPGESVKARLLFFADSGAVPERLVLEHNGHRSVAVKLK